MAHNLRTSTARVNRSIYLHAVAFLSLFALLLLASDQFSRLSAPRSMLQSGKVIHQATGEKTTLTNPHAVAKPDFQPLPPLLIEIRRRSFGVGLFPHPVEFKVPVNYQEVDSSIDAAFYRVTGKLRGVQAHPKDRVRRSFHVRTFSRHRPAATFATRFHSWLIGELGLAGTSNKPLLKDSYKWTKHQKAAARKFALR
jgi:hypothetical protein